MNARMKETVRILLVSDIHNSGTEGMDPTGCDAAIVAGDFKSHGWSSCDPAWRHAVNDDPFFRWCDAHPDLPVFLVQNGIASRVIASDIGEGPLNNAKKSFCETIRSFDDDNKMVSVFLTIPVLKK